MEDRYYVQHLAEQVFLVRERMSPDGGIRTRRPHRPIIRRSPGRLHVRQQYEREAKAAR
jgi:hypothetical protein